MFWKAVALGSGVPQTVWFGRNQHLGCNFALFFGRLRKSIFSNSSHSSTFLHNNCGTINRYFLQPPWRKFSHVQMKTSPPPLVYRPEAFLKTSVMGNKPSRKIHIFDKESFGEIFCSSWKWLRHRREHIRRTESVNFLNFEIRRFGANNAPLWQQHTFPNSPIGFRENNICWCFGKVLPFSP